MRLSRLDRICATLAWVVVAAVLGACASGPDVFVQQDPAADFSQFRTYNFEPRFGTNRDNGSQTILSSYFKSAISREMDARGYTLAENPDLMINVFVNTEEKIKSRSVPTSGGYYGYRGGYYNPWGGYGGYETQIDQYTEGTVNIDLIDARKDQLVWEGVVVGKITKEVRENLQQTVDAVTAEIFRNYPYAAGSNVIQAPAE